MNRRPLLQFAHAGAIVAWCASCLLPTFTQAQAVSIAAWPAAAIKIIVPSPPGVGSDLFARQYAEAMAKSMGVAVVVENKPGAALTIAANLVAKSPPDGYTVLFSPSNPLTISPFLLAKLPYNAQKDLLPVLQSARGGSFILANTSFAANDLKGLVAMAKTSPGKINFATYGPGSTAHIGLELLQDAAGIDMLNVPYKTSALPDLIGGQVHVSFEPPASAIAQIKSGKLKALAYTGSKRNPAMPDVPTMAEAYPGLEMPSWLGIWVAAATPPAIIQRLHAEFSKATHTPEVTKRLLDNGLEPAITSPEETAALIQREADAMGRIIKAKNIKIE